MTITVNGSAEVLSKLSFEGNETAIKCGTYQPVKWSVKIGNAEKEACASYAEVITKLNESNAEFNAGDTINNTYVISWEWALETAKDTSDNYNIEDTCIGYKANGTEFTNLPGKISGISQTTYDSIVSTMTIDLIVKVEQIQVKATN